MDSTETIALRAAAVRNNAEWCATVCRSHGIVGTRGPRVWWSARRTPPYYPDAVTLHPDAAPADFVGRLDTSSPGCSVKDSFASVDLTAGGFAELFEARWIHRPAGLPLPGKPALSVRPVSTAAGLRDWQRAWHGGDRVPDVFRAGLLGDPSVAVLALERGDAVVGGVVLNRGAGVVGLSNLFAVDETDTAAVLTTAIGAAGRRFPGLPLVGYEQGDDLASALDNGFTAVGPLRVWSHGS